MTTEELNAIQARVDAASGGPWRASLEGRDHESGSDFIRTGLGSERGPDIELSGATAADYDFIAHVGQDIPRLLAEVHRLQALVDGNPTWR